MDGKSTDGTVEFIEQLNSPNMVFESSEDKGIYDALNKGMAKATGDIIGILHSDDVFSSEHVLAKVEKLFESGADAVYADLDYVQRDNLSKVFRRWKSGNFNKFDLRFGWIPPHPTFFLRRSILNEVGNFDLRHRISSDYDFMLRVLLTKKYNIAYLPETTVKMRVGGESNKSLKNIINGSREDYSIAKKHFVFPLLTVAFKIMRKIPQLFLR